MKKNFEVAFLNMENQRKSEKLLTNQQKNFRLTNVQKLQRKDRENILMPIDVIVLNPISS